MEFTPKPKLTAITQPGDYVVCVRRIRDEDVSHTQNGDPKIKVLLTTSDNQKINETFFGSTDGALQRISAFVGIATKQNMGKPPRDAEGLRQFLSQAEGKLIKVSVVKKDVTFKSGETRTMCVVTRFMPFEPTPEF
jgi:hypothetical protein